MIPAPILHFALLLIIAEHMSSFLTYNSKFKSDNYISMQMSTINNERFQIITVKNASLNNIA